MRGEVGSLVASGDLFQAHLAWGMAAETSTKMGLFRFAKTLGQFRGPLLGAANLGVETRTSREGRCAPKSLFLGKKPGFSAVKGPFWGQIGFPCRSR